jgi:hypothetical protein
LSPIAVDILLRFVVQPKRAPRLPRTQDVEGQLLEPLVISFRRGQRRAPVLYRRQQIGAGRLALGVHAWRGDKAWQRIAGSPGLVKHEEGIIARPHPCQTERRIAYRCACRANSGRCSQILMPGTLVAMGINSPRMPSGASGFRSNVSCWDGPPVM